MNIETEFRGVPAQQALLTNDVRMSDLQTVYPVVEVVPADKSRGIGEQRIIIYHTLDGLLSPKVPEVWTSASRTRNLARAIFGLFK